MTLLDYQVMRAVAIYGSFAKAAQMLHITPSAISHAVAGMEEECGFSLFLRGKNGTRLTQAGQRLYPAIQQVLAGQEAVQQTVHEINGMQKGKVTIGVFNSACTAWMPRILQAFQAKYPSVIAEVYQGSYDDIVGWLRDGVVELGFLASVAADGLEFEPLYNDRMVCAVPEHFKALHSDYISIEELAGQEMVIQRAGVDADVRSLLEQYGIRAGTITHTQDDQATMAMVEGGRGICVVPQLVLSCFAKKIREYPLEPETYRTIGLAHVPDVLLTPVAQQMAQCIRENLHQMTQ